MVSRLRMDGAKGQGYAAATYKSVGVWIRNGRGNKSHTSPRPK